MRGGGEYHHAKNEGNMNMQKNHTPTSGTEKTNTLMRGMTSLFGRDADQVTVAKSLITSRSKLTNKVN